MSDHAATAEALLLCDFAPLAGHFACGINRGYRNQAPRRDSACSPLRTRTCSPPWDPRFIIGKPASRLVTDRRK